MSAALAPYRRCTEAALCEPLLLCQMGNHTLPEIYSKGEGSLDQAEVFTKKKTMLYYYNLNKVGTAYTVMYCKCLPMECHQQTFTIHY